MKLKTISNNYVMELKLVLCTVTIIRSDIGHLARHFSFIWLINRTQWSTANETHVFNSEDQEADECGNASNRRQVSKLEHFRKLGNASSTKSIKC